MVLCQWDRIRVPLAPGTGTLVPFAIDDRSQRPGPAQALDATALGPMQARTAISDDPSTVGIELLPPAQRS